MTRARKLVLLLITYVPVIVLIIVSAIYVRDQIEGLSHHVNLVIADELGRRFHKEVRVGQARIDKPGEAVIEDIRISKGTTFAQGTLASVRKVIVHYNLREMLQGRGAASVSSVEVIDPKVQLVRRADGSFNITELLKSPPGPKKAPFQGKVAITGGQAEFIDYFVSRGQQPTPLYLSDVKGTLSAASLPLYRFSGTARGTRGQLVAATFSGVYHADTKRAQLHVNARGVRVSLVKPYVFRSNALQIAAGKLDAIADVDIHRVGRKYEVTIAGTANLRNVTASFNLFKAPVTGVQGRVDYAPNRAVISLRGVFAGSPVQASGTITDFKAPVVNAVISSPNMDVGKLIASTTFLGALAQFGPSGRGPVNAKISGKFADLNVEATARVPHASIRGVSVEGISVAARYRPGRVEIASLRLKAKGASVSASGVIATKPTTTVNLHGTFSDLSLAALPIQTGFPVSGMATGTFSVTGPASNLVTAVRAVVANGSVAEVPFSSFEGDIVVSGTRVTVKDAKVQGVFEGAIQASGAISGSSFDLSFTADSIDIASLAERLGQPGYSGTAFMSGHAYGTLKSPHVEGSLEVFGGKADDYTIDHARITFAADRNHITVSEGLIQSFPAEISFSGEASGLSSTRIPFAGKASVRRLEMTKLLELSKRELDVTGTLAGDFQFSGTYLPKSAPGEQHFKDLAASGSLTLDDATAFGYPVSETTAKIDYANDVVKLAEATITSEGARLSLDGTLNTQSGSVDAGFTLTGFDLARLHEYLGDYAVLGGTLSASGRVEGPMENAKGSISAKVEGLSINYEKFETAEVRLSYDNGKFVSYALNIARAGQSLVFSGTDFDPETECIGTANGVLTDISVPDVWGILRASPFFSSEEGKSIAQTLDSVPKLSTGRVNGSFSLTGCLMNSEGDFTLPDGQVDITATNVGVDVQQVQKIELKASIKSDVVSLEKFAMISDDTSLEISGNRAYENGIVHLEVRADNLKLSQLDPWIRPYAIGGVLSAVFNVDGAWYAPDIIGSVEVVKPSYAGFTFDRLRASQVQVSTNRIEVPDILLSIGGHQATANASVPWDWSSFSIPKDEPLSFAASLSKQSLSILSAFLPIVDKARTAGTVEASFQFGGTLLDPQMQGVGKITGGTIAIAGFTNTFTDVAADVEFTGDRVVVNKLSATSSTGGNVHVVPGGYVTVGISGTSEANLRLVADRLTIAEKNLLGIKESVSAQIDAGLSVMGPPTSPLVADAAVEGKQGGISISHAKLSFQIVPRNKELGTVMAINPKFNVSLRVGDDVVISPPSLQVVVTGRGVLAGSLAQPRIQGMDLKIVSGEISLATARLGIAPGGTIRVNYEPPAPPDVSLDFQATANVFAVNSLQQRERYRITVQVSGQAAKPTIDLSSTPPGLTRAQMLAALGHVPGLFTSAEAGLQQELATALTAVGTSTLLAPLENIFTQKLGFEQFSLEYSPIYPLSLYASRHLFGDWYIAFYRQITTSLAAPNDVEYEVVLTYRLKSIYQFSIGADNEQTLIFQVGYAKAFR